MEKTKTISFKQDGRFYFGWGIVLTSFLIMTLGYVSYVSLTSFFMLPVTKDLGCDRAAFAMYMMFLCLTAVVASPILGKMMGKGSVRRIMLIAAALTVIGFIGFSRATAPWMLYAFAIPLGIGFAGTTTMPISLLINNWFGGKVKGTAMGFCFIGSGLGTVVVFPLMASIIGTYGWRVGYLVLAGLFLVILMPLIGIFAVKTPEEKGFKRMGQTAAETQQTATDRPGIMLKDAKKTPMLWMLVVSIVLVVFGSSAVMANMMPYLIGCGLSPEKGAFLISIIGIMMIVGKPLTGFYCDRVGIKSGVVLSAFVFAAAFLMLFLLPNNFKVFVIIFLILYGLGAPAITVTPPLIVNGVFGEKDYAAILGIVTMATNIGGAFGGTIAAKMFDLTGSYSVFWITAACGIGCAGLLRVGAFILKERKYDENFQLRK